MVPEEGMPPVLSVPVAAGVHELLVLAVGDLELVQEVIGQRHEVIRSGPGSLRRKPDHPGRDLAGARQRQVSVQQKARVGGEFGRLPAFFRQPHAQVGQRNTNVLQGRLAH